MSAFCTLKTKMTDPAYAKVAIAQAMKDVLPGFTGTIEQAPAGETLTITDYHGDQQQAVLKVKKNDVRSMSGYLAKVQTTVKNADGESVPAEQSILFPSEDVAAQEAQRLGVTIISGKNVDRVNSMYSDFGVAKQKDGTLGVVSDDYLKDFFGPVFQKRVEAYYTGIQLLNAVKKNGGRSGGATVSQVSGTRGEFAMSIPDSQLQNVAKAANVVYQGS